MKKRLVFLGVIALAALAVMHEEVFLFVSPVRYWTWKLDDPAYRLQALGELGESGAAALPSVERIVKELGREETNVPEEARSVLVAIGEPAIPPLRAALGSSSELLVANAADALARLGALAAVPDILAAAPRTKNHAYRIHSALARLTLGTDALRKTPGLEPGLALAICDGQRDVIAFALRRLPPEERERITELDPAAVKKLSALPRDEHGRSPSFQGDQVGCPATGARFIRDGNVLRCANHGPN